MARVSREISPRLAVRSTGRVDPIIVLRDA
jgi:hypothetical protein